MLKISNFMAFLLTCSLFYTIKSCQTVAAKIDSLSNQNALAVGMVGDGALGVATIATAVGIETLGSVACSSSGPCTITQVFAGVFGIPCLALSFLICSTAWCTLKCSTLDSRMTNHSL